MRATTGKYSRAPAQGKGEGPEVGLKGSRARPMPLGEPSSSTGSSRCLHRDAEVRGYCVT